ncbi:MAG: class I SAM-dependent methyltransferase [Actinomycetota bacterium]
MSHPTIPQDASVLDDLRTLLLEQAAAMEDVMGTPPRVNPRLDPDLYERRLAEDNSRPATLAKLFLLGKPVSAADAASALDPFEIDALARMGLAQLDEGVVRPLARVSPHEGVLLASDLPAEQDPPDLVTGPSASARRVERLTIRRPVRTALDLGTGSGVQALLTARHAERVVAVDVNRRGLAFARFNAALNGLSNIELREGSWLEPVGDERFDLVVANPPYVVSPDTEFLYRDGQLSGDAVTQQLLRDVPAHLEEGGFAHVMGNWGHGRDEDWRGSAEAWLAGSGCDVLLLNYATHDPVLYAAHWNQLLLVQGREPYLSAVDRWLDYYRRTGIEAITEGMVVLRRRSGGRNWVRAIEVPGSPTGAAGDHVFRLFEARDRRAELTADETLLGMRFAAVPGLRVGRRAEHATVELEAGIGFAAPLPVAIAERIASLDGSRPLGEAVDGEEAAATVRRLFSLGLLVFSDDTR